MEERNLKLIFKYKEDLLNYGQEKLYNEMINIIKAVDDRYIINAHPMDDELFLLLGFKDNEEVKEKLNKISVCNLEQYIKTFTENIFKSLEDERSFISRCLKNTWDNVYCNLEIEFKINSYNELQLTIMSISKTSGCGSGRSFNFDIIDSEHLKQLISEVNAMDIPKSVKGMYVNFFNEESEDNLDLGIVKDYIVENIVEGINEFIYQNENKYKQYKTLQEQGVKEELIKYIEYDNWFSDIADAINVDYGLRKAGWYNVNIDHVKCKEGEYYTNENKIEIKFLGDPISRGRLCPKGAASRSLVTSPSRLDRVKYRRPYSTRWESLDLDTALDLIADRVVATRNETWEETQPGPEGEVRVNRTLGLGSLGGATLDNEENYLIKKLFTALGAISIENQARI